MTQQGNAQLEAEILARQMLATMGEEEKDSFIVSTLTYDYLRVPIIFELDKKRLVRRETMRGCLRELECDGTDEK